MGYWNNKQQLFMKPAIFPVVLSAPVYQAPELAIKLRNLILAFLSGLLLTLAFPQFDLAFLVWIALVPVLIVLNRQPLTGAFLHAFLTGISFSMGMGYWVNLIPGFTLLDYTLGGIYWGSYLGLFGLVFCWLSQQTCLPAIVTAPPLWIAIEYLRSHVGFLGIPWSLLGHSQYENLWLIQIAAVTGVYGVSFVIVMVNVAVSETLILILQPQSHGQQRIRSLQACAAAVCCLCLSFLYGYLTLTAQAPQDTVTATVLQGNIPQDLKWRPEFQRVSLETHARLTREVVRDAQTSLIVWPETSIPGSITQDLFTLTALAQLVKETNAPLLVGSLQRPLFGSREFRKKSRFNAASLITSPKGIVGQYNKIHLLPFGEYLPYKEVFPWPARLAAATEASEFLPGKEYMLFDLEGRRFGVLICWEALFPELVRQFVKSGAEFLVNITNEAQFGESAVPYQVIAMTVFRAAENRLAIVRAANTGVSCFIDPHGRIMERIQDPQGKDIFVAGHLTRAIPLFRERTFYMEYGDVWAYLNLAATGVFLLFAATRKSRQVRQS